MTQRQRLYQCASRAYSALDAAMLAQMRGDVREAQILRERAKRHERDARTLMKSLKIGPYELKEVA